MPLEVDAALFLVLEFFALAVRGPVVCGADGGLLGFGFCVCSVTGEALFGAGFGFGTGGEVCWVRLVFDFGWWAGWGTCWDWCGRCCCWGGRWSGGRALGIGGCEATTYG